MYWEWPPVAMVPISMQYGNRVSFAFLHCQSYLRLCFSPTFYFLEPSRLLATADLRDQN